MEYNALKNQRQLIDSPVKACCLFIAQYAVDWTTQSALHFTHWKTCSFRHQLNFSVNHSVVLQLLRKKLLTHISTTGVNENVKAK